MLCVKSVFIGVFFFSFSKSSGVYNSNNVIQISNYCNWPWWWVSLAFTTVCLIPKDGQLSRNAHFIEIIVLIMALKIHYFVSTVESRMGTPHSGIQQCVESMLPHLVTWLWLSFFLFPSAKLWFWNTSFLPVKSSSSWGEQPQVDKVWDVVSTAELTALWKGWRWHGANNR